MRRCILYAATIIVLLIICACNNKEFAKVYWQGDLIQNKTDVKYLYWQDGNQYFRQQEDSVIVELTGFSVNRMVLLLISLRNNKNQIFTFLPNECTLSYDFDDNPIDLKPSRPKNLDKKQLSLFNSIISSAGTITKLIINIPADKLISQKRQSPLSTIDSEYRENEIKITKKIFVGNHTLMPQSSYAGFLVFEYEKEYPLIDRLFTIQIVTAHHQFTASGTLRL